MADNGGYDIAALKDRLENNENSAYRLPGYLIIGRILLAILIELRRTKP